MKKVCVIFALVLILALSFPQVVYANMAAPKEADIGSAITFEKNDIISVLSEILDITVEGSQAKIVVTYKMKNAANESVTTKSMFLSPNIKNSDVKVTVNGLETDFQAKSYVINYSTQIKTDDWQYVVLTDGSISGYDKDKTVDTITFEMSFAPNEEFDVIVSYRYALGGYPDYDYNNKEGIIYYYLAPATMWKDFSSLTINLHLDEDMPVVKSSNFKFKKVASRTYQYVSDKLPDENLKIIIDENWWQNFKSSFKNPYWPYALMILAPFILLGILIILVIIFAINRLWKRKKKKA